MRKREVGPVERQYRSVCSGVRFSGGTVAHLRPGRVETEDGGVVVQVVWGAPYERRTMVCESTVERVGQLSPAARARAGYWWIAGSLMGMSRRVRLAALRDLRSRVAADGIALCGGGLS